MSKWIIASKLWNRGSVKSDKYNLYIFGDNTDRTSGRNLIAPDRFYTKKYGKHCRHPWVTSACIRGLNNALPISTQRWYHTGKKGINGRWTDEDLEIFKSVIDDEIRDIKNYIRLNKPRHVILPPGGLFNSPISDISEDRVPRLYNYLKQELTKLMS